VTPTPENHPYGRSPTPHALALHGCSADAARALSNVGGVFTIIDYAEQAAKLPPLNREDNLTPLTVPTAAPYLRAHPQTVYRWIRTGRIPRSCYFKRGRQVWFTPCSVLFTLDMWRDGVPTPLPARRLRARPRRESFEVDARAPHAG
jgi:excisionase family DNA binding protein